MNLFTQIHGKRTLYSFVFRFLKVTYFENKEPWIIVYTRCLYIFWNLNLYSQLDNPMVLNIQNCRNSRGRKQLEVHFINLSEYVLLWTLITMVPMDTNQFIDWTVKQSWMVVPDLSEDKLIFMKLWQLVTWKTHFGKPVPN